MQKRARVYIAWKRQLNPTIQKFKSKSISLFVQAHFPDSGYYYSQKLKEVKSLERELVQKGVTRHQLDKIQNDIYRQGNKKAHEYYEVIRVIDTNGKPWTAAEMDAEMVNH